MILSFSMRLSFFPVDLAVAACDSGVGRCLSRQWRKRALPLLSCVGRVWRVRQQSVPDDKTSGYDDGGCTFMTHTLELGRQSSRAPPPQLRLRPASLHTIGCWVGWVCSWWASQKITLNTSQSFFCWSAGLLVESSEEVRNRCRGFAKCAVKINKLWKWV